MSCARRLPAPWLRRPGVGQGPSAGRERAVARRRRHGVFRSGSNSGSSVMNGVPSKRAASVGSGALVHRGELRGVPVTRVADLQLCSRGCGIPSGFVTAFVRQGQRATALSASARWLLRTRTIHAAYGWMAAPSKPEAAAHHVAAHVRMAESTPAGRPQRHSGPRQRSLPIRPRPGEAVASPG